jgi:hypothetical protein
MPSFSYALDLTGTNPANKIPNEQHVLTRINNQNFYVVIPNFGPFYLDNLVVTHTSTSNVVTPLNINVDYYPSLQFIDATRSIGKPLYGCLTINNLALNGIIKITYQSIGGDWTQYTSGVLQSLAENQYNARVATWEQVANPPALFPPTPHTWDVTDLVGQTELINAIHGIEEAINQSNGSAPIDKNTVGLGLVQNLGLALDIEVQNVLTSNETDPNNVIPNKYISLKDIIAFKEFFSTGGIVSSDKVGDIKQTFSNTPPSPNWLPANGANYAKNTYPDFSVLIGNIKNGLVKWNKTYTHLGYEIKKDFIFLSETSAVALTRDTILKITELDSLSPTVTPYAVTEEPINILKKGSIYFCVFRRNDSTTYIRSSTDLVSWTTLTNAPNDYNLFIKNINNEVFISNGSSIYKSGTGDIWSTVNFNVPISSIDDVVYYSGNYYVACVLQTSLNKKSIIKSNNLVNWTTLEQKYIVSGQTSEISKLYSVNNKLFWVFENSSFVSNDFITFDECLGKVKLNIYDKISFIPSENIYLSDYKFSTDGVTWDKLPGYDIDDSTILKAKYIKCNGEFIYGLDTKSNSFLSTKILSYNSINQFVTPLIPDTVNGLKTYIKMT